VATRQDSATSKVEIKSKASGIVKSFTWITVTREAGPRCSRSSTRCKLEAAARRLACNLQAAEAALDSSKATLERNKVDAEGPDVPF